MSTCLSSRACGFDLEHMIKWPYITNSTRTTSNSSSPSSTLSESTNSPIAISSRKARKPRKRPNQTYNEAAALLSMACPNIFNTKHLIKKPTNLPKFTKHQPHFFDEPPELIETSEYPLRRQIAENPCSLTESKITTLCQNTQEIELNCDCVELKDECLDEFDTESILDEEIEQGIDSIMGESNSVIDNNKEPNDVIAYGYPIGLGFGMRNGVRALKNCDDRNWWCFPMVDVSPAVNGKFEKSLVGKKKKKKVEELMESELGFNSWGIDNFSKGIQSEKRLVLKLDYDDVLNDWSGNWSPVPEEIWHKAPTGGDIYARAANIDLFSEKDGRIEASATRFMDKNQSKKNGHPVKNASSDRRPRCKGRFVKKSISTACDGET
ncbi:protein CHLOROPLAST IMPORT APPARATUS 2-like [Rutidosis leptorrhynchoides]|uniref:protein CHLOROPLAST IMPORT APPARATUS 2-like n=1 Tax=Rutidosis leptorrhynchoides TaxID=125765 RepID=UPI003A98DDF9